MRSFFSSFVLFSRNWRRRPTCARSKRRRRRTTSSRRSWNTSRSWSSAPPIRRNLPQQRYVVTLLWTTWWVTRVGEQLLIPITRTSVVSNFHLKWQLRQKVGWLIQTCWKSHTTTCHHCFLRAVLISRSGVSSNNWEPTHLAKRSRSCFFLYCL